MTDPAHFDTEEIDEVETMAPFEVPDLRKGAEVPPITGASPSTMLVAQALALLLGHADYNNGGCYRTEMICSAIPGEVLEQCHRALEAFKAQHGAP